VIRQTQVGETVMDRLPRDSTTLSLKLGVDPLPGCIMTTRPLMHRITQV
jgi:hypothetical protein